jgi:hypothetical protein
MNELVNVMENELLAELPLRLGQGGFKGLVVNLKNPAGENLAK